MAARKNVEQMGDEKDIPEQFEALGAVTPYVNVARGHLSLKARRAGKKMNKDQVRRSR